MLITAPHIRLKPPGKIQFHEVRLFLLTRSVYLYCCWFHHRGILPLEHLFACDSQCLVCISVCEREGKSEGKPCQAFMVFNPLSLWNVKSYQQSLWISSLIIFHTTFQGLNMYGPRNTLELKCMKSLLDELQTFSIRIWLDIYSERLRHKVKCQLFHTQLLSINNTWLLVQIAV